VSARDEDPGIESDGSRLWSSDEWQTWVARKIEERCQIFKTDPDEMVAAYLRETATAQDYHGRELLELLQNADDAGEGRGGKCRAAIVLSKRGLCVANTGTVFSAAGVKSLMLTNNSPKRYQRARYIGNKGLGFRSILGWTTCPFILSGNLELAFSRSFAEAWLEQLCSKSADVRRKVERERRHGAAYPVPLLSLPFVGLSAAGDPHEDLAFLHQQALSLRDEGYNTIVGIPFSSSRVYEEVAEQLDLINRDVLLFTRHLREVRLSRPGSIATWEVERDDELVEIKCPGRPPELWQVFATGDDIPQEHLRIDQRSTPEYEIKLAVPTEPVQVSGFLFSYFVTQVRLPLPVVVHATVELTHNRKNLVESRANQYLVKRIASFIREIAGCCATPAAPWNALSVLAAEGPFDPVLEKLGLPQKLVEAARSLPIVPVRSGALVHHAAARRLRMDASAWLPCEEFGDLVQAPPTETLAALLNALEIPELTSTELGERLERLSAKLALDARVSLLAGLIRSGALPTPPPRLLIDDDNRLLPLDEPTFLPPGDDAALPLPPWTCVHLLSRALATRLRTALGAGSQRDLVTRLAGFKVREYAFAPIASAIHAATNARVNADPAGEAEHRADLLRALLILHAREARSGPVSPPDVRVILRTRAGTFASASMLYLGAEYPHGRLTDALYHASPERLVASPEALGVQGAAADIDALLTWLGVEILPRKTSLSSPCSAFTHLVTERLRYPAFFDRQDFIAHTPEDLSKPSLVVSSVDGLDAILEKADPHAIVAWLDRDPRLEQWRAGDADARLRCFPPKKHVPRELVDQTLPSFVSWLIETTAWVPTTGGGKVDPAHCTIDRSLPEEVQRVLCRPVLQASHPLLRSLQMDERRVRSALERAGVRPSLHHLSWDDFYGLLLELPRIDPDGRSARTLYRVLFGRAEGDEPKGTSYERFRTEGKLWGSLGGKASYFGASELYYDDNGMVPALVRSLLPLFQFDRRRGAHKVERLFGVTPLQPAKVTVRVDSIRRSPRADELGAEIERLKPVIYAMRTFVDTQGTGLVRLRKLDVQLCENVAGRATIGDRGYPIALSAPGEVLLADGTAYVIAGSTNLSPLLKDELLADAVGELFAAVFQIESGGDFARLASCSAERRTALLARVLGVELAEAEQLVDAARAKLEQPAKPPRSPASAWVEPPSGDTNTAPAQGEAPAAHAGGLAPRTATPSPPWPTAAAPPSGTTGTGAVTTAAQPRPLLPQPRSVRLRVRKTPRASAPRPSGPQRPVVDPVHCQQLAAWFEEAEGQGRFPLPVDHLQGSDAYGCDVLSFASAEDRERFRKSADVRLVARFIEVKGRGHEHGRVELRGNELQAARQYKERFFVYRVYDCEGGEFEIALLPDPTTVECDVVYEIDVSRSPTATFWRVVEVAPKAEPSPAEAGTSPAGAEPP